MSDRCIHSSSNYSINRITPLAWGNLFGMPLQFLLIHLRMAVFLLMEKKAKIKPAKKS